MSNPKEILNRIKLVTKYSSLSDPIFTHEPSFKGTNAYEYIKDCLDTGWVSSSGKWVSKFEDLIKEFTGCNYVVAVASVSMWYDVRLCFLLESILGSARALL